MAESHKTCQEQEQVIFHIINKKIKHIFHLF